jgi:hypothetical protein
MHSVSVAQSAGALVAPIHAPRIAARLRVISARFILIPQPVTDCGKVRRKPDPFFAVNPVARELFKRADSAIGIGIRFRIVRADVID